MFFLYSSWKIAQAFLLHKTVYSCCLLYCWRKWSVIDSHLATFLALLVWCHPIAGNISLETVCYAWFCGGKFTLEKCRVRGTIIRLSFRCGWIASSFFVFQAKDLIMVDRRFVCFIFPTGTALQAYCSITAVHLNQHFLIFYALSLGTSGFRTIPLKY